MERLDELERTIERGLQTFVNVGNALREIRDDNLHTVEYDTFEAYCSARWVMKHSQAYRLIDAAEVTETIRLSPIGEGALPATESQARPLTKLEPDRLMDAAAVTENIRVCPIGHKILSTRWGMERRHA